MFKQVIYCSKLLPEYDLKEVYSILKKARETNPELGLSGYLIFGNDCFIQILEGFNAPLTMLMQKIMADKRHTDIKILQDEEIKFLEFQNWAMGFANLTEEFSDELKEYMQEIGQYKSFDPEKLNAKQAKKILKLFSSRAS